MRLEKSNEANLEYPLDFIIINLLIKLVKSNTLPQAAGHQS